MKQLHIPAAIKGPSDCLLTLELMARGVQVYRLVKEQSGTLAWVLAGPEAELVDESGGVVGKHCEGPTWRHNDGSEIRGKLVARADATDPNAIPWLLLEVTDMAGTGLFSRVSYIQRVETSGGRAPLEHDCGEGELRRVPYTAVYRFLGLVRR